MRHDRFEVFPRTPDAPILRLWDGADRLVGERSLVRAEVERLAAEVDAGYRRALPDLPELGRRLYAWLDGPTERWLEQARQGAPGLAVHVDVEERLRHLPWELLGDAGGFLCGDALRPFTPVRRVATVRREPGCANRPLRVLFMASAPEDVRPPLDFEKEEGLILGAIRDQPIELVVEESGSLAGLRKRLESHGRGNFDVFHLSGHADVRGGGPRFLMEDDVGSRRDATAAEIAGAFAGNWPRLVFFSGCKTGLAEDRGSLPSLCEAIVQAGAPAVLGWALPVGDRAASAAAAALYHGLAVGRRLDEAVARARQALHADGFPDWHFLRLYADATPLTELVTEPNRPGRRRLRARPAHAEFLDAGSKSEVCPRDRFVGRRRILQRCLRVLRSREGTAHYAEGVLLRGMGGLGKSSLAARLCERLAGHRRAVWVGRVDEAELLRVLADRLRDPDVPRILNEPALTLAQRVANLLEGLLATTSVVFVFDDFEHNLDDAPDGTKILKPPALAVLGALLRAIRTMASESRVIVTSRHAFSLPGPARLHEEGLERMRGAELEKKLGALPAFAPLAPTDPTLKDRATVLAAGNPRLLEWLNRILSDARTDHAAILSAVEAEAEKFREDVLLRALLAQQDPASRRLLALLSTFELPVDRAAVDAVAAGSPVVPHLDRAAALGLVEAGIDPATQSPRYYVSSFLATLLDEELSDEERNVACQRAARFLYQTWWIEKKGRSEERALEIHRLALLAGEKEIAGSVGDAVASAWVYGARYREAVRLCEETLKLGADYHILLALGRAEVVLGNTTDARLHYDQALALCPEVGETTTQEVVKYRGSILGNLGDLLNQQGDVERALALWQEALALLERIGDVRGKATALHQMAGVIAQQGDVERALALWQESLALKERIGDVQGKAATLASVAWAAGQQGDIDRQRHLNREAAAALASVRAWLDVVTVLGNLGSSEDPEAPAFLAQALWLGVRVAVPVEDAVNLVATLVMALGPEADARPADRCDRPVPGCLAGSDPSPTREGAGPRVPGSGRLR